MRFEVRLDEKSKKADYEVSFIVTTRCVITNSKRVTIALGDVTLNHRDQFDLRIGAREALKKALTTESDPFTSTGRAEVWKAYCKAFGIKTKEGHDLKHELASMKDDEVETDSMREHYDLGKLLTDGIVGKYAKKGDTNA